MRFIVGLIVGFALCLAAAYLYLTHGGLPVATAGGPVPFEQYLAKTALRRAIGAAANESSPLVADEANLRAGAHIFTEQCAVCHGVLGHPPSAIAAGMYPKPPQLLPPKKGVTDDPIGETYWKVRNGIRLTGMPGFKVSLSDTELWQVSLFLSHADKLPPSAQSELQQTSSQ